MYYSCYNDIVDLQSNPLYNNVVIGSGSCNELFLLYCCSAYCVGFCIVSVKLNLGQILTCEVNVEID